jgi:signal transduction histidine kinase
MIRYKQILNQVFKMHPRWTEIQTGTDTAQDRECISKDLHDHIGPGLFIIRLQLEELKRTIPDGDLSCQVDSLSRTTSELIQHTREIIWALNPQSDGLENTLYFIRNCFVSTLTETSLTFNISYPDFVPDISLPISIKRCLILSTKEMTDYLVRHTTGTQVDFCVNISEDNILVEVRDNGGESDLLGEEFLWTLKNVRRRIHDVRGTFTILPASQGMIMSFNIPL